MRRELWKPAEAVRKMLEGLAEDEQMAQAEFARMQDSARLAAEEVAQAQARLVAVRAAIVEWRDFQRQHCE